MTETVPIRQQTNTTQPALDRRGLFAQRAPGPLTTTWQDLDSWIDYARFRIKEATTLEPDWDHEGALVVSTDSAEAAQDLALRLARWGVRQPMITPSQKGGITFEWISPRVELSIEVIERDVRGHVWYVDEKCEVGGHIEEVQDTVFGALTEFRGD